jgi:non-homologous end joining protein Ku
MRNNLEDGALVLELMHFAEELADPSILNVPKQVEMGKREMNMATALIDSMSLEVETGKITRRLSRSAHGSNRRES